MLINTKIIIFSEWATSAARNLLGTKASAWDPLVKMWNESEYAERIINFR